MNLAKVRSATTATIALALTLLAAPAAAAEPRAAELIWLPPQTTVAQLAAAGYAPGLMSAGLGSVPARQTYLDVGQGNRVFDSLYDEELPAPRGDPRSWWRQVLARARSAPAEIEPGLLRRSLAAAGREGSFATRGGRLAGLPRPRPGETSR